ncbi:MAG: (d)CMP kinase [Candidatus Micrarchaeota archaeon]
MIICISGLSGSGKNSVGELVAAQLGLRVVKNTFKDEARKKGIKLMELQKMASSDKTFDNQLDEQIKAEARKGNCVVVTWLGSWIVENADFRVWLHGSPEERAKRISGRDKMKPEESIAHINARDENNRMRYLKYYGIDIFNHENFDMEIDTGKYNPEQIAEMIVKSVKEKVETRN